MDKGCFGMIKEIGGYLEFEKFNGKEYYSRLLAVNNARNALLYLLRVRKIKKIYIPYFLCDSVFKPIQMHVGNKCSKKTKPSTTKN